MALLKQPKTPQAIGRMAVGNVRKEYNDLAKDFQKLLDFDIILCPKCGKPIASSGFYPDERYVSGVYPVCKKCLYNIAEQRTNAEQTPNVTKESSMIVLQMLDLPFIESFWKDCEKAAMEGKGAKQRSSAFAIYISSIKSLPNWRGLKWKDSKFDNDDNKVYVEDEARVARPEIRKKFGPGFTESDYLYLQDQYDDWVSRTQVDSKSQETYIERICFKLLDIWKAQKAGKETTGLDKSLNDLMAAANLQPKQNVGNASTDSLSFGQLIEKWEQEKPISEPSPEFRDVDGIGKYIRVFFAGHLAKALGLKNAYSKEYDEYINNYTVNKPEYEEEGGTGEIYDKLFGGDLE